MNKISKTEIKYLTNQAETEYAETPPSGEVSGINITKEQILDAIKTISIRKPIIMIVGSVATQGKSKNDIDILIRGDDLPDSIKDAINFRLYRLFTHILKCDYNDVIRYVHIHYNNYGSYTSYIPLYELVLKPIDKPEVVEMTSIPISIKGDWSVVPNESRIIAGYASVIEIDKHNQLIPKQTLEEGIKTLLDNPLYSNLMVTHNNIQIGRILESYGNLTTHVDDNGLFIVAEIRDDLDVANQVWEMILNGELNSFSIAGEILLDHQECDDNKCYTVIDKLNIFEVSVCKNPVNTSSGFVVIASDNVCNKSNIDSENMKEELDVQEKSEEKVEEDTQDTEVKEVEKEEKEVEESAQEEESSDIEEKSDDVDVKTAIDSINREIEALKGIINEVVNPPEEKSEDEEDEECEDEECIEESEEVEEKGLVETIKTTLTKIIKDTDGDLKKRLEELLDMVNNLKGKYPYPQPSKYPYPSQYPYPAKKDIEELEKSIDELKGTSVNKSEIEELKLSISEKDKVIKELMDRVQKLESIEQEPKALSEPIEEIEFEPNPDIVRDSLRPGVIFRDVD